MRLLVAEIQDLRQELGDVRERVGFVERMMVKGGDRPRLAGGTDAPPAGSDDARTDAGVR